MANRGSSVGLGSVGDSVTEVTTQGFLSRILKSIVGVLIGVLLFLGSFVVLYINEGRVDMSGIASRAVVLTPGSIEASANGKLVAVSGPLAADGTTGDNLFLKPGP